MKTARRTLYVGLALLCQGVGLLVAAHAVSAADPSGGESTLRYDRYSGYFVLNTFEPKKPSTYAVIASERQFAKAFGVAAVMNDKSKRAPQLIFHTAVILAVVKRGPAICTYQVDKLTGENAVLRLYYTAAMGQPGTATFASPLIVSAPRGNYEAIEFVENGKVVSSLRINVAAADPVTN